MHLPNLRRGRRLVAAAATLGLLGMPLLTTPAEAGPGKNPGKNKAPAVKVMTRNVYLGANIMRPIGAIQQAQAEHPGDPVAQLDAFANANDLTRDIVDQTDFDTRAELLAAELVENKPDLVGLQEVALWRSGPMDNPMDPTAFLATNATQVDYDFLDILLEKTNALGAGGGVEYKAILVGERADVEGPAYQGSIGAPQTLEDPRDVRLTMHDVILMRVSDRVKVARGSKQDKIYEDNLSFDLDNNAETDNEITFSRGYQSVDVLVRNKRKLRFINTHLEAFGSQLAYDQAQEMLEGPAAHPGRTVVVCDCNSDPANGTTKPGDTQRHWAPYFLIKREGDFHDTWLQWAPPEEGFTSGLGELVNDETAKEFDHRIDMVFARNGKGHRLPVLDGDVTGDEVEDKDPESGLWPSDHAGVVMKLRLK